MLPFGLSGQVASIIVIPVSNPTGQQTPPPQLIVMASPFILKSIWSGALISPVSQTILSSPLATSRSRLAVLLQPILSITPPSVQQSDQLQLPVINGGVPLNSPASSCTDTKAVGGRHLSSNVIDPPE